MTRILVDLSPNDIEWLDMRATDRGQSRAAILREAVAAYRSHAGKDRKDWIERGCGYWTDRTDIDDAVEFQRVMRGDRTPSRDI